jgi:hypothetical protein
MSRKKNIVPQSYSIDGIEEFFTEPENGSWIRWMESAGGYVYFDNNRNVEVYGSIQQTDNIISLISTFIGPQNLTYKILDHDNIDPNVLQANRGCVYGREPYPKIAWLKEMVKEEKVAVDCAAFIQRLKDADQYKGVEVQFYKQTGDTLDIKKFREFKPLSSSVWMAWGYDMDDDVVRYVYTDSDENMEVYTTDMRKTFPELPPSNYNLYVKLDKKFGESPKDLILLSVARSRLYQATDVLQASEDQLQDMVMRMTEATAADKNNLSKWSPYGTAKEGDQLAEWTYKPTAGRLPVPPQFYFNPKPLKKGDPSKLPKTHMATMVDLQLGGTYGEDYE